MEEKKISKVTSGLGWSFGERILAQGVTFVVSIVIARILSPQEYGLISLVLVFINLANVFVANGFGEALIQKKNASKEDFSTMFWCTFVFSIILYFILFQTAPSVGQFYNNNQVVSVLRVLSLKIPLASINTIQHAYVSKHMQFKKFFFSTLGGTVISGIVGIIFAYMGAGVWALVAQYLINSTIDTIVLLITVKWHPQFVFEKDEAIKLFNFSWKVTGAAFLNEVYTEIRSLIIGKVYSAADLAYYNKGNQFPSVLITNINSAINTVFFPVMASMQDEIRKLKNFARKSLKISSFIIFPLMAGLIGTAEVLVKVLLTEKWLPSVPYLRILCIFYASLPLQSINWQLLKAVGRSDICLKLEIVKKAIGFALILGTMFISVEALAGSTAIFSIVSMFINMIPNRKIIDYKIREQLCDIFPNLLLSTIMGALVWIIGNLSILPDLLILSLQILVGIVFYFVLSYVLKIEAFTLCLDVIRSRVKNK